MPVTLQSVRAAPGEAEGITGRYRAASILSNGSPTRHTGGSPLGFTLLNTRRMRSPRFGRDGTAST